MIQVHNIFDSRTSTFTYIVWDDASNDSIIIDSVLDYEQGGSIVFDESIQQVESFLKEKKLIPHFVLETHAHADHLTGAAEIKKRLPSIQIGIGKKITKVQGLFKTVFNVKDFNTNGVQFDLLMEEGIVYKAGSLEFKILFTPGHTPACTTILVGKYAFTGDALFKPDVGTGRCDFPGGSAEDLYDSVHEKLYKLPEDTVFCSGHDYPPEGRKENAYSTMDEQRLGNKQLKQSTTKDEYVDFRKARDATLSAPKLIYPSLQVNIDAGSLPKEEDNNKSYMKVPINKKGDL